MLVNWYISKLGGWWIGIWGLGIGILGVGGITSPVSQYTNFPVYQFSSLSKFIFSPHRGFCQKNAY
ncbi:MAG: hypothetical protein DRI56_08875 [Chloroflexota bacterium]|nr:MAG: hypothetical protein DRI56_08875 [Chloroflexota bacterium]